MPTSGLIAREGPQSRVNRGTILHKSRRVGRSGPLTGQREEKSLVHPPRAGRFREGEQRDPSPRVRAEREIPDRPRNPEEDLGRLGNGLESTARNPGRPAAAGRIRAKSLPVGNRREGLAQPTEQGSVLPRPSPRDPQDGRHVKAGGVSPRLHQEQVTGGVPGGQERQVRPSGRREVLNG